MFAPHYESVSKTLYLGKNKSKLAETKLEDKHMKELL